MRHIIFLSLLLLPFMSNAQKAADYSDKVQSIDSTIETLYSVISGEKGEERNWELFKYLFHRDAKLIPTGLDKTGTINARFLTPEDYIKSSGNWLVNNGFYEVELHRDLQRFGNIAQVFSTYESFRSKDDTAPFMRGINSIQLLHDGSRWWILNVYWTQESEENPIPQKYLPH